MATDNTFYIDATTFANATAVYTDQALTVKAADGFYQAPIEGVVTYREQSGGTLGTAANCTCAVSQVLDFNTSPTNLCCVSQTGVTYFIDQGTTFDTTTGLYTDATAQTPAPDNTYQVNGTTTYRVQSGGSLGAVTACATCPVSCGAISIPSGAKGSYSLNVTLGTDLGAIVVYFNPQSIPDGVRGVYNNVSYNALSIPGAGYVKSTSGVLDAFTVLGDASDACLPSIPNTTTYNLYDSISGGAWVQNGTESVTINTGDVQGGGINVYSTMVIPKANANPQTMDLKALGPCNSTAWNLEVVCPTALPSWSTSTIAQNSSANSACAGSGATAYFAKQYTDRNDASVVLPILHNWVFSDSTGATTLPDGFYKITATTVAQVANGVVTAITACSGGNVSFSSSGVQSTVVAACVDTVDETYFHNGSGGAGSLPSSGNTAWSDNGTTVLPNGIYKLNGTSYYEITGGNGTVAGPYSFALGVAWTSSVSAASVNAACALSTSTTFYHNGNSGVDPVVNNTCYTDACKSTTLPDGFYKTSNSTVVTISGGSGNVSAVTTCVTYYSFAVHQVANPTLACSYSGTLDETIYTTIGTGPAPGVIIYSDQSGTAVSSGVYVYQVVGTNAYFATLGNGAVDSNGVQSCP
tara:strand:+ start:5769 stop:7682 length:1914 start_codon:yes stop_codon:yes gene_type:complete